MPAEFFDLQVNGFAGVDFQQANLPHPLLEKAAHALIAHRTPRIFLTLISEQVDHLCRRLEYYEKARAASPLLRRVIAGYHLEGPWLSPEPGYYGAHDPAKMCRPSIHDANLLIEASGGNLRLVTLAPELPNSDEVIAHLKQLKVRTAAGHTNADDKAIDRAIQAGLDICTHLGNAVPSLLNRHDNIIQRLLARDELIAVFIPDGIHLPPATLRNMTRAKPPNKVWFTTDCMAAAGAPAGRYTLGKVNVEVGSDGIVREPNCPNFAGSALTMDQAAENVASFLGWSLDDATCACSSAITDSFTLSRQVEYV